MKLAQVLAIRLWAGFCPGLVVEFLLLFFADWKSSTKLPAFSEAIVNKEENVIQKAPGPAPVSSPEMLKTGETPSKEPRDRYGTGNL